MNQFQMMMSKAIKGEKKPHGGQAAQPGSPDHGAGAELAQLGLDDPNDNATERIANIVAVKVFDRELTNDEKHFAGEIAQLRVRRNDRSRLRRSI